MRAFFHGILSQARKLERVKHRVCPNHTFTQILAYLTPVLSEKNTSTSTKFPLWSLFFFSHVCCWTLFVGCFFFSFIYLLASLFFVSCCLFPLFVLKTNHCPTSSPVNFYFASSAPSGFWAKKTLRFKAVGRWGLQTNKRYPPWNPPESQYIPYLRGWHPIIHQE